MMLERYREEEEEGIEKIGQTKKRARYVRPLKKLNHPHHPAFENIPALDMMFEYNNSYLRWGCMFVFYFYFRNPIT